MQEVNVSRRRLNVCICDQCLICGEVRKEIGCEVLELFRPKYCLEVRYWGDGPTLADYGLDERSDLVLLGHRGLRTVHRQVLKLVMKYLRRI